MIVHQLLGGAGPVDAVTSQARAFRELFDRWGWGGEDAAAFIDPRVDGGIRPLRSLRPGADDVLLLHYSAYAPRVRRLLELPNRKLLISHNITPARYFWTYAPVLAVQCSIGRRQLPDVAQAVDLAAGVSEYNAAELRNAGARRTAVIPVLFDSSRLGSPAEGDPSGPPTVLYVGRLAPHKRPDELIRAFALYRRNRAPDARLVLIGEPVSPGFGAALEALAGEVAPGAVTFEHTIAPARLWERYRGAHAFLSLSEHEGFCIPLLECFHFGVPAIARPVGGIPEVARDAALLVEDPDLAVVAELLDLAVSDRELRAELARLGRARLPEYEYERTAQRLREAVESVAGD